jgi:hypothetical protein
MMFKTILLTISLSPSLLLSMENKPISPCDKLRVQAIQNAAKLFQQNIPKPSQKIPKPSWEEETHTSDSQTTENGQPSNVVFHENQQINLLYRFSDQAIEEILDEEIDEIV